MTALNALGFVNRLISLVRAEAPFDVDINNNSLTVGPDVLNKDLTIAVVDTTTRQIFKMLTPAAVPAR